jgi:hypothetical protein
MKRHKESIKKKALELYIKMFKEENDMKLVPLGDKVVLKQLLAEETTKSGIVLPVRQKKNHNKLRLLQLDRAEW